MTIKIEFVYPPVPSREYDWLAYDDDIYDGGEGSKVGCGPTEQSAIDDLFAQLPDEAWFTWMESRPMSQWSETDGQRYAELTGQTVELLSTDSSNELMREW